MEQNGDKSPKEDNYVILSDILQRINYMFRPLFGHHQVVLSLQG